MFTTYLKLILLLFIISIAKSGFTQDKVIEQKIYQSLAGDHKVIKYYLPELKEKAILFSISISVNKLGEVDSVIYTNRTKLIDSVLLITNQLRNLQR